MIMLQIIEIVWMIEKELASQNESVIFSEDCPVISSGAENSSINRFKKYLKTIGQHEWISQFDIFSIPLKLTFNGEDIYKTQFGGLVVLFISLVCIFFTLVNQFPNGLQLNTSVQEVVTQKKMQKSLDLFDGDESLLELYFYNTVTKSIPTNPGFLKNVWMYQVINGQNIQLELSKDCKVGTLCFKKSAINAKAEIFSANGREGYIQLQMLNCGPSNITCYMQFLQHKLIFSMTNYEYDTNKIVRRPEVIDVSYGAQRRINVQKIQYTTNNMFFGFIANIFSKTINYYRLQPVIAFNLAGTFVPRINPLVNGDCNFLNSCTVISFRYDGTTVQAIQRFDDITAPILFFLALKETLLFLAWILFLKNYSNNCLHLKIADTLVYIPKEGGQHYNFKTGGWLIFACLIHHHPLIELLNKLLFKLCQIEFKRVLPLSAQLAIHMIAYGEECLTQKYFFGNLNTIYDQENVQPTKIIPNLTPKDGNQDGQDEAPSKYFENEVQEQAFQRLCRDHEHFSHCRKKYISLLLKESNKNHKLVLVAQQMFRSYKKSIEKQRRNHVVEIPVDIADEQISGNNLKMKE